MAKYKLSKKAVEGLNRIWEYTVDAWSEHQADIYYAGLISAFETLASHPKSSGKSYEEIRSGLRGLKQFQHLIFYIVLPSNQVFIVRVLHEMMDFTQHLQRSREM